MLHIDTPDLNPALLKFLHHLQRTHRDQIGSIPTPMLRKYADSHRLHTLLDGKEPLGYIIANDTSLHPARTKYPNQMRIYVACIDYSMQRRLFGTMLVDHIEQIARLSTPTRIGLWCADDIPAREFWTALGFRRGRTRMGGSKRGRMHIEYTRPIVIPTARSLSRSFARSTSFSRFVRSLAG